MNSKATSQFSYTENRWRCHRDEARISAFMKQNEVDETLALFLSNLNLNPGQETVDFLSPSMKHLYDPFLMLGMDKAIDRLQRAIKEKQSIRVVTDYDVDGTMSSLILQSALQICGHTNFSYHIPNRKQEGYGFSLTAAEKAIADGVKLIVTADIGVRDEIAIAHSQAHGIDVIVLDHHLPVGEGVPPSAYAVLCPPQAGCNYPNKHLAACGISLKFAQALLKSHPKRDMILRSLMKLAALGTVADVVSLLDKENRAIVTIGLEALNHDDHRPGLKALLDVSKAVQGSIDSSTIGFRIGPRINAAGRLSTATLIIELLHARNSVEAQSLASKLDSMNEDRQAIQEIMIQTAVQLLSNCDDPFLVAALDEDPCWHSGISGIVAGRLREHFHKPVAVATIEDGMLTGSIRSTPGVHAVQALTSVAPILTKFGGHAAAAGFSCPASELENLKKGLCQNAIEQLNGTKEIPVIELSLCIRPEQVRPEVFDALEKLEPCGSQNNRPLVCIRDAKLTNIRLLKEKHLSATIENTPIPFSCIWFSASISEYEFGAKPQHLVGELQKEIWNGTLRYKLIVRDACPNDRDVFTEE